MPTPDPKELNTFTVAVNVEDLDTGLVVLQQDVVIALNRYEAIGKTVEKYLSVGENVIHSFKTTISANGGTLPNEIYEALAKGEKIRAIKAYREISGLGLKDAKEFIDKIYYEHFNSGRDNDRLF